MEQLPGTRETILQTALRLFSRRGFEATGMQEIALEAGITKPTLYYHFGSKQGLLEAIIADFGVPLLSITETGAKYGHDLVMNLTNLFRDTVEFARNHADFFRLLTSLSLSAPESCAYAVGNSIRKRILALIEALFAEAVQDHGNMRDRQKVYAENFFALIQTWALLVINGEVELTPQNQRQIVHQFMHGIFS
jgi:TetR/AcrR family transcriptional regulator